MKAVVVSQAGDPSVLQLVERPIPSIKDGWSLVKVMGFGINRSEIFTRKGYSPNVQFPRILGIECVGVIEESSDEKHLPVGTKVVSIMGEMGRAFDGGYAEYALLPNNQIYPIQTELDWNSFSAVPETYYTAFGSLLNLKLVESDCVLVRGGTSGVGVAFAKLARAMFPTIKLYASTRDLSKQDKLIANGFDGVILEKNGELQTALLFDKVLELVGPSTLINSITHMTEGGIVCMSGLLGGKWTLDDFNPISVLENNIYLTTFHSHIVNQIKLQTLFDTIAKYNVNVQPEKIFTLEQVQQAHEYLESQVSFGKVIVRNFKEE